MTFEKSTVLGYVTRIVVCYRNHIFPGRIIFCVRRILQRAAGVELSSPHDIISSVPSR